MNLKEIWLEFFKEDYTIKTRKEYNTKILDWIQIFFRKYGFIYLKDYVTVTYLKEKWIQIEFYSDVCMIIEEFKLETGLSKFKYLDPVDKDAIFRLELNL